MENILKNPLTLDLGVEEQELDLERKSTLEDSAKLQNSCLILSELKIKELQPGGKQIFKDREETLEEKEPELCVQEKSARDILPRAESLQNEQKFLFMRDTTKLLYLLSSINSKGNKFSRKKIKLN